MGLIDHFTVFHRGGVVLFSRTLNPVKGRPVDALVQNVLLEEKKGESSYKHHVRCSSVTNVQIYL